MRDRRGVIIYVGKAKDLRRRVSSYFRPRANHAPKVRSMVDTVFDFEWMTVKNDAEALLTEAELIKRHKPHFNILMRDDKRYLRQLGRYIAKLRLIFPDAPITGRLWYITHDLILDDRGKALGFRL